MRLIDADALGIGKCNPEVFDNKGYADGWNAAVSMIENAPTIDAEPVRHGKWSMRRDSKRLETIAICSCCAYEHGYFVAYNVVIDKMPYCPNCGAKMDGESEGMNEYTVK